MSIPMTCPTCAASFKVKDKYAGRERACPNCGTAIRVRAASDVGSDVSRSTASFSEDSDSVSPAAPFSGDSHRATESDGATPTPGPDGRIRFNCTGCGKRLKVKAKYAGRRTQCDICGTDVEVPGEPRQRSKRKQPADDRQRSAATRKKSGAAPPRSIAPARAAATDLIASELAALEATSAAIQRPESTSTDAVKLAPLRPQSIGPEKPLIRSDVFLPWAVLAVGLAIVGGLTIAVVAHDVMEAAWILVILQVSCAIVVLYHLFKGGRVLAGILSIGLCCVGPWVLAINGWIHAGRLGLTKLMIFWSVLLVLNTFIVAPALEESLFGPAESQEQVNPSPGVENTIYVSLSNGEFTFPRDLTGGGDHVIAKVRVKVSFDPGTVELGSHYYLIVDLGPEANSLRVPVFFEQDEYVNQWTPWIRSQSGEDPVRLSRSWQCWLVKSPWGDVQSAVKAPRISNVLTMRMVGDLPAPQFRYFSYDDVRSRLVALYGEHRVVTIKMSGFSTNDRWSVAKAIWNQTPVRVKPWWDQKRLSEGSRFCVAPVEDIGEFANEIRSVEVARVDRDLCVINVRPNPKVPDSKKRPTRLNSPLARGSDLAEADTEQIDAQVRPSRRGANGSRDSSKASREEVARLISRVESNDYFDQREALEELAKVQPSDELRQQVARAISPLIAGRDPFVRAKAIATLANWQPRKAAIALASMLDSFSDYDEATQMLIKIGPPAEDAVVEYLRHPNAETRHRACVVLSQIGTDKSLDELRRLRRDPDMGRAAQEAHQWIRQRVDSTKNPFLVEGESASPAPAAKNPFVPKD